MIRFAWIRFRTQALVGVGLLVAAGVVLLVTRMQLDHAYATATLACPRPGFCGPGGFPSQGYLNMSSTLGAIGLAVPALIGMFWGAPLVAREFETGTYCLAWTQGVSRVRWLAAKFLVVGVAAMIAGELFSLAAYWWSAPIRKVQGGTALGNIGHTGITPAGYALFGLALGVAAGLFIRHTLPAMAVTLAVYTAVLIVFPISVRPHLLPPAHTTVAFAPTGALINITDNNTPAPDLLLQQAPPPDIPGAWIYSYKVVNQAGQPVDSVPSGVCATGPQAPSSQACATYLTSLHLRQNVTYQPASRYWAFEAIETAVYLALSLLLAGLCFWKIRPARPAASDSRNTRPIRPAPALETSP